MTRAREIIFDFALSAADGHEPFRLDLANQTLWRGPRAISLTPKAFALLGYLVQHSGRLITKEELLDAVWPETYVSDAVLKVCIREIRKALGDDPKTPRFIETMHRRGYRFIGKMADGGWRMADYSSSDPSGPGIRHQPVAVNRSAASDQPQSAINLVGRETALTQMQGWLEKALRGERQVVFVTGEAGIGKTTVGQAVLERAAAAGVWTARGQCLDQYGAGEAYMPVLEALGRLCREPGRERLMAILSRHAPTWLVQIPWLINAAEREGLQREILGATRNRMLREMAEAMEALTAETPLVLVLEDLHWGDYSTLDLVSALAQRREPARLLLIGTYRPVEVILRDHPLKGIKQELQLHRQCEELPLEFLSEAAVAEYLGTRFPASQLPAGLAHLIHWRTDGNPLFMVTVVDYLVAQGLIVQGPETRDQGSETSDPPHGQWELKVPLEEIEVGVPESIRQMIEKQIERLDPHQQRVLEAASVAGEEFSAVAVAAALEADIVQIEEQCQELVRQCQFLQPMGISELPDGTVAARYRFIHALYQNVLYDRVAAGRRIQFHQRIGERGERIYGRRAGEMAAELAMHFEQGRDYRRAVKYLERAAHNDARRYANREAIDDLTRALELVERLPETEQAGLRLSILEQRGLVRRSMGDMKGSAEDFEAVAAGARQQAQLDQEVKALLSLSSALFWVDRGRCLATIEQANALSRHLQDELLRAHTRGYCAHWHLNLRGWCDEDAQAFVGALEAARRANDRALLSLYVVRNSYHQCLRSEYDAACRAAEEGMRLALEVGDAFDYLLCRFFWAWALLHSGRWREMQQVLQRGTEMAQKNGHHLWALLFQILVAWLHQQAFDFERARDLCEPLVQQAQAAWQETGQLLFKSLTVLGLAHLGLGHYDQAFDCFSEIIRQLEREGLVMDWILQMPLRYGLSEYWLAQRDYERARQEAERLCALAAQPRERTYLALGRRTLAEIALAEQHWDQAEAELSQALAVLEGAEAPLAAWRVYATAAHFHEQRGQTIEANRAWARSAAILNQLADSLGDAELRQTFVTHPSVQPILRRTHASSQRPATRSQ